MSSNGSYYCHTISPRWKGKKYAVDRIEEEGSWSLPYSATNHFRNELVLRNSRTVYSLCIAQDSQKMVLWSSWGDPDDCIDLVYEKVEEK